MLVEVDLRRIRTVAESRKLSQASLVQSTGISRSQLGRLLSTGRDRSRIRQATAERLATSLGLELADLLVDGHRQAYLQCVAAQHEWIDFRGAGIPLSHRQKLDAIFVEPPAIASRSTDGGVGLDSGLEFDGHEARSSLSRTSERLLVSQAIVAEERMVVLGNPGAGKTTLLRWLARRAATDASQDQPTPIFVRLSEWSRELENDPGIDMIRWLARQTARQTGGLGVAEVERLLRDELKNEKRPCLVLLDGLDEVGDDSRRLALIESLGRWMAHYPRNRFVLTSRPVGFDATPWTRLGFSVVRLVGYEDAQIDEFVVKWSRILPAIFGRGEEACRASLRRALTTNARVRAMGSNPLVLTILTFLNESRGGTLPRRRVDLYAKVVDVFLDSWERAKSSEEAADESTGIDLDAREFSWLLSDLALAMQKSDRTLAARWWIIDRLFDCLQSKLGFSLEHAKDAADRLLRYLSERAGLLEERGPDQFAFSHRSLQEYFAASGVVEKADASSSRDVCDQLRGIFYHPQWHEVVRLVAAQATPAVAESLIASLVDDPDPSGRFLRRGALLALSCLSDGATVANRLLVAELFDGLKSLGQSRWLGITFAAIDVLQSFVGTRHEQAARESLESILTTSRAALSVVEHQLLHERAHWQDILRHAESQLDAKFATTAAREVTVDVAGSSRPLVFINASLRTERPDEWFRSLDDLMTDASRGLAFRERLADFLGSQIATDPRARRMLRELLAALDSPLPLRAACASALGRGADDSKLLAGVLRDATDVSLRAACAASLRLAAPSRREARELLLATLRGDGPAELRAAAARGLTEAADKDPMTADTLLQIAEQNEGPAGVRMQAARALERQIGRTPKLAALCRRWLDDEPTSALGRAAARILAQAMAEEKIAWDRPVVETIEQLLVNIESPRPYDLECLEAIVNAREVRQGLRLERVLEDALKPLAAKIAMAFVFGSTARRRQTQESDIDLMIVGDATLRDVSSPLRLAEQTLGRRVNPVLYSRVALQQKHGAGDPFLADVLRKEKLPVIPARLTRRTLDDELRAMVAEQLAADR